MTEELALTTEGLGKRYGRHWGLADCTIGLPAGKVIALVGPNGAGKTTLLRLIVGLLAPTTGSVLVFGRSPATNTPEALARIGFMAQDHPLYRRFTIADLLRLGRSMNPRWDQGMARDRLADLGIPLDRRASALSGGQQAQVALALALAKRPDLLVLDEPMAALDPLARREFLQTLMVAVAEHGITVLFSSHVMPELERVCDHLLLVRGGRVALVGDIEDLLAAHRTIVGPRGGLDPTNRPGVIEVTHSERHTTMLVRHDGAEPAPGWESHPVSLEDMVLAYLRTTGDPARPGALNGVVAA